MKFKFSKKHRLILIIVILMLVVFLLPFWTLKKMSGSLQNFLTPALQPAHSIRVDKPLEADWFFSNEPDSSSLSAVITAEINKAQRTLEIAVYSIKSELIKTAIYDAYRRGVKVTLILDYRKTAIHDEAFKDLPAGITRLDLGSDWPKTILMHHKFVLIDRGLPNQELIFGSFNWTELQEKYDRSFIMRSADANLVSSFGREFDRLAKKEFGPAKLTDKNYQPWDLSLVATPPDPDSSPAINYEVWFGPGQGAININNRIFRLMREAKQEIKVMIWDFTDRFLAEELLHQAQAGLKVTIIADSLNFYNPHAVFKYLLQEKIRLKLSNLEILTDPKILDSAPKTIGVEEPNPFLHYHVIIVDGSQIIFGTNNWSQGGAYYNDEAAIVSNDPKIITVFQQSFDYNYRLSQAAP